MAKLSMKQRKKLPKKDFAIPEAAPESGSYPVPDASHARNALARVSFGSFFLCFILNLAMTPPERS